MNPTLKVLELARMIVRWRVTRGLDGRISKYSVKMCSHRRRLVVLLVHVATLTVEHGTVAAGVVAATPEGGPAVKTRGPAEGAHI